VTEKTQTLQALAAAGVSVWLDDLSRARLSSGGLAALVDRGVVGVTTNPTIFEGALRHSADYAAQVHDLAERRVDVEEAVRMITSYDVRWACDVLRGAYDASGGLDGRVSIEVDPRKARAADATVAEARGLWWLVDRPNLFVKIPATLAGLPAISRALAEGISVNVTLIFGLDRYRAVMGAYMAGLEEAAAAGLDLAGRSAAPRPWRCAEPPPSRMPDSPTRRSNRSWRRTGGRRWPPEGPGCSARCGPPRGSRTPSTPTPATWTSWWHRTP
jgi:transaldolase